MGFVCEITTYHTYIYIYMFVRVETRIYIYIKRGTYTIVWPYFLRIDDVPT